ncbi:hypothetical protein HPB48_025374 [Haemaphysalis longicornis]|uniref:Uncharacterized protein n=1 Tax=Haemaphysalis longicornis TaxID=44386 RepID=A0A9J6H7H1_HAELO|nr:hypothetical protein HPB48_025374 [Haemaphysalis longicornis]
MELARKYRDIIENMSVHWRQVAQEFNCQHGVRPRTSTASMALPKRNFLCFKTAFSNRLPTDESTACDNGFVKLTAKDPCPDEDFQQLVDEAVDKMARDASSRQREELHSILLRHHDAFTSKNDALGLCPHVEHSIEL